MSSIKGEKIEKFELGPFWEGYREMLDKLVETNMPSKSRMHYTEVIAKRHPDTNNLLIFNCSKANLYMKNKKHFILNYELSKEIK